MYKSIFYLALLLFSLLSISCGGGSGDSSDSNVETRSIQMGFTPWLYEASFTAQDYVYDQIQQNGDIISHHFMGGIPWQEALDGSAYPQSLQDEISTRLTKTLPGKTVYLSIDSLDGPRTELAPNWGATQNEPRSGAWATRTFDSPEVIQAYGNFALDLIARFDPVYFNYAVEISGLMFNSPAEYDAFVIFADAIYSRIKTVHPNLIVMVSLSLKTPDNAEMQITQTGFARITNQVDMAGISIYPYAFFDHADKGDPATLPADWMSQINTLAPGKPVAVTETAWAAEDLVIPTFMINLPISNNDQGQFTDIMLNEAERLNAAFVIWFSIADYDTLWTTVLGSDDVGRIWRDTGFYDENLNARPALDTWQTWLARPFNN